MFNYTNTCKEFVDGFNEINKLFDILDEHNFTPIKIPSLSLIDTFDDVLKFISTFITYIGIVGRFSKSESDGLEMWNQISFKQSLYYADVNKLISGFNKIVKLFASIVQQQAEHCDDKLVTKMEGELLHKILTTDYEIPLISLDNVKIVMISDDN
jgi:hypothetical protein